MNELFSEVPLEEPHSNVMWQAALLQSAIYAQRRYRYHTLLLIVGKFQFTPSLLAFQKLTQRTPERFETTALALLHHSQTETGFNKEPSLWQSLTGETEHPALSRYDSLHLANLCKEIEMCAYFLTTQGKRLTINDTQNAPNWKRLITTLCILIEELSISYQPYLPLPKTNTSLLEPYPDEMSWQELHARDPRGAAARAHELELQRAKIGQGLEFHAHESLEIYRRLRYM